MILTVKHAVKAGYDRRQTRAAAGLPSPYRVSLGKSSHVATVTSLYSEEATATVANAGYAVVATTMPNAFS